MRLGQDAQAGPDHQYWRQHDTRHYCEDRNQRIEKVTQQGHEQEQKADADADDGSGDEPDQRLQYGQAEVIEDVSGRNPGGQLSRDQIGSPDTSRTLGSRRLIQSQRPKKVPTSAARHA